MPTHTMRYTAKGFKILLLCVLLHSYGDRPQRPPGRSTPPAQVRTPPPLRHPTRSAPRFAFAHSPPLWSAYVSLRSGQEGPPRLVSHLHGRRQEARGAHSERVGGGSSRLGRGRPGV